MLNHHSFEEMVEPFSMGRLRGPEPADFVAHLLHCMQCQEAVPKMDQFLVAIRGAAEHSRQHDARIVRLPLTTRCWGQYLVVQAALPSARLQNIGVLLIDVAFDRLYSR